MRKWMPLIAVCLGTFMLLVDVTIVNVALPDMAVDLHTSFSSLQWVIDSYAVALAALLMGLGSLADLRGRRRVYLAGLAVFAAASLASGLATSPGLLIVARGVQGVGGAAMFATTIALLNTSYQGRDRGPAFGVWGAVAGASAAVGPAAGRAAYRGALLAVDLLRQPAGQRGGGDSLPGRVRGRPALRPRPGSTWPACWRSPRAPRPRRSGWSARPAWAGRPARPSA